MLGRENVPCIAEVVNRLLKADCTDFTKVRSGHNISCLCNFLVELSSCRVTYENCYINHRFFLI